MTRLHRMNLKGPWDYEWLDGPHALGESSTADKAEAENDFLLAHSRVRMPSSIEDAWGAVTGQIRFRRRFQKPTNLESHERVHIAFDGLGGSAAVLLNDEPLVELQEVDSPETFDVTDRLGQSNVLSVELTWQPGESSKKSGGLWGPVALEIHDAS
jgi:beta-galactosidase/beta-glucuronidase